MRHINHSLVETTRPAAYKAWSYWGKKPPNIVRQYIENYCPAGGVVLDPFAGSCVTVLEGVDAGRRVVGVDLNPIGLYLAEDLLRYLDLGELKREVNALSPVLETIDGLFTSTQKCHECDKKFAAPAVCFHWRGNQPIAARVDCSHCGARSTYEPTSHDLEVAGHHEEIDEAVANDLWAPDVLLGYSATKPFIKVGGSTSPRLKEFFTGRNWYSLALLRATIAQVKLPRMRHALLAMMGTFVPRTSSMMMVRATRPDSSNLARQAYWQPDLFMELNPAELVRRAIDHHQGYGAGQKDANERFGNAKVAKSVRDLLAAQEPAARFVCGSALDIDQPGADFVPDSSVDFIFTDPPYGGAVQYMEMFTLWWGWLSGPGGIKDKMRYDEEITINDAQAKDQDRYNLLMTAAFRECYRVLKEKRWMEVTFHHTDVGTFTSIVDAAQTAGFVLQLVSHQPSLRASDKALAQPYGSATGNYYLRFHKPAAKGRRKKTTISSDVYERIIEASVMRILAKRGEPTTFTQIMNEIYVDLSHKGVLSSGQKPPAALLQQSDHFQLIETEDSKLWWFTDESKIAELAATPLGERVEKAVLAVLRRKVRVSFDEVLQEVLINFPNAMTPESSRVRDFLREYADKDSADPGMWRLKPQAEEGRTQTEHSRVIASLVELGAALGFSSSIGKTERPHAWQKGRLGDLMASNPFPLPSLGKRANRTEQIDCIWFDAESPHIAFEVENTTTITSGIVRMSNLEDVAHRVIVLPQSRKRLLEQKLAEPLLNPEQGRVWTYLFYEKVDDLLAAARKGELDIETFLASFEVEAYVDDFGQGLLVLDGS